MWWLNPRYWWGRGKLEVYAWRKHPKEAEEIATQILGMEIKGLPVRKVLIDEAAEIEKEIYLGITNDRAARKPVMMASSEGGVDIEEVARTMPEKIIKVHIDPLLGLRDYQARDIAAGIDLDREHWRSFGKIARVYGMRTRTVMRPWLRLTHWSSLPKINFWLLMAKW